MHDDDLAAELDHIRACIELASELPMTADPRRVVAIHAPLLLAAIEAVLELAGEWEREARRLHAIAAAEADPQSRIAVSLRAQAFEDCAKALRGVIERELAGKGGGDD